jgi:hypothetical protein
MISYHSSLFNLIVMKDIKVLNFVKNAFQFTGADADGKCVLCKK